jgi:hypothetical protein
MIAAISPHTGARLAEVGFLLVALAGATLWLPQLPGGQRRGAAALAGLALAAAGVLLIVAVHWGHFGA